MKKFWSLGVGGVEVFLRCISSGTWFPNYLKGNCPIEGALFLTSTSMHDYGGKCTVLK